jgi:aryl-alcohol dehydrogenase-like predicted oxidoreductase
MQIYEELDRMRSGKLFRYIGLTGHTAFEPMHRLVETRLFDQLFLAYGYFPKGMDTMLSQANLHWRELCITRARELGMGVLAMKVLGSFVFGHNAKNLVPDFGEQRLRHLRAAAIRWALREDKPIFLVLGTSLPGDIDQNVATLRQDWKFTPEDRKVLADFTVRALGTKTIQGLKVT